MPKHRLQLFVQLMAVLVISVLPAAGQNSKDLPELAAVTRELKGGETHSYQITLSTNQFLHAIVEQKDIDVATAIFGPDGKQLTESDSPNDRWGSEPILWLASIPGEYRVDVRGPKNKSPAGQYEIKILALREATQIDKDHATAQLAFDEAWKLIPQQTAAAKRAAIEKCKLALPLFQSAGRQVPSGVDATVDRHDLFSLNEFRSALDYLNQARALAVTIGDRRLEAGTETCVGGMLDILGDVSEAMDHYPASTHIGARRRLAVSRRKRSHQSSARFTPTRPNGRRRWSFTVRRCRFSERLIVSKTRQSLLTTSASLTAR